MNSEQRVMGALKREAIDRIPCFEWLIDQKVIDAIMPGANYAAFSDRMGLDGICVDVDYKSESAGGGLLRNEWGVIYRNTGEAHAFPVDGPIRTAADFKAFTPPDPKAPERFASLEKTLDAYGGKRAVIFHLNDVWSIPSRMMPFEQFIMKILDEPELILNIVNMTVDFNIELARQAVARGVKIIYTGDDYAYNSGPVISPALFGELFGGPLKRVMRAFKEMGLLIIKHSDGNIMPIIDLIVDSGIDCLDPIDPVAGMDLAYIKKAYGERICIKGNVNCAETLSEQGVRETVAETIHCIKTAGPGGGYIFSSSNSIHSSVKPENYIAMLKTWEKIQGISCKNVIK